MRNVAVGGAPDLTSVSVRVPDGDTSSHTNECLSLLAQRISTLESRPWYVQVDLKGGPSILVDCARRSLLKDPAAGIRIDCQLEIAHGDLVKLLLGELTLRHLTLYAGAKVDGSTRVATHFTNWLTGVTESSAASSRPASTMAPTSDLSRAWGNLGEFGYAIVENALEPNLLKRVRTRVVDQAVAEREAGCAILSSNTGNEYSNQRLHCLINKGSVFMDLLEHPLIDEFALKSLGEHFCIGSYFSVIAGPGGKSGILHHDQMSLIPPVPNVNIGINLLFFLDEFTEANGATRVIPRSHLPGVLPDDIFTVEGTVPAEGPAGSALIFDSRLWHATGANSTDQKRHGLFLFFTRAWVRPPENPDLSTHPAIVERMSDRVKTMHGLRHTSGVGRVQDSREGSIVRYAPEDLIMEMHPSGSAT